MYSRPQKLVHINTIQYEIDMLDYCYNKVTRGWKNDIESFLSLEGFLLHYRNLVEFFADHGSLKVSKCEAWVPKGMAVNKAKIKSLKTTKPYERHRALISQYLQHCTETRIKDRSWDVVGMYAELRETLANFRKLFPVLVIPANKGESTGGYSTATVTTFDPGFSTRTPWGPKHS
ncbi:MAG: hypothetical protein A3B82_00055 [Methylophilales bacterium RIFCSPHIGHO2_02_FULL_57_10]|nr:MAG: hypothetical protein A3B82_00055 [Methylophilales bacterium RIFCSPHIGHO2_02_FULL_57_10]